MDVLFASIVAIAVVLIINSWITKIRNRNEEAHLTTIKKFYLSIYKDITHYINVCQLERL